MDMSYEQSAGSQVKIVGGGGGRGNSYPRAVILFSHFPKCLAMQMQQRTGENSRLHPR